MTVPIFIPRQQPHDDIPSIVNIEIIEQDKIELGYSWKSKKIVYRKIDKRWLFTYNTLPKILYPIGIILFLIAAFFLYGFFQGSENRLTDNPDEVFVWIMTILTSAVAGAIIFVIGAFISDVVEPYWLKLSTPSLVPQALQNISQIPSSKIQDDLLHELWIGLKKYNADPLDENYRLVEKACYRIAEVSHQDVK